MDVRATYRLQLGPGLGFDEVGDIAPYLASLGVSHAYLSPILQAAPSSTHGYDVVDPSRVSDDLGGRDAFERMAKTLRAARIGLVVDVVPNHMAIAGRANAWWWDVLENGPSSRYAAFFDIDWDPPEARLRDQILVPILADHYGRVLEGGDLALVRRDASFTVCYFEHEVPVSPRSLDDLLARAAAGAGSDALADVAAALGNLAHAAERDPGTVIGRRHDLEEVRSRLAAVLRDEPRTARAVDEEVGACNADIDHLDALIARQNWRLAFWRAAADELDYRRFFDVSTLVALRMEREEVFTATHELLISFVSAGIVDGLRIDHPDGLKDPAAYLHRLRAAVPSAYVVVEKILDRHESLPAWPVQGTTGYDFMDRVLGLLVDPAAADPLTELYARFTGEEVDVDAIAHQARHDVMSTVLAADINRLTEVFMRVADSHRRHRDHSRRELRDALSEVLACFGAYRSYVQVGVEPSAADVDLVEGATRAASAKRSDIDGELFAFLADVLLLRLDGTHERELALRFQQVCSAVTAKGVEDTAFYRYHRFAALNEVGGHPGSFGISIDEFHEHNAHVAATWPATMLATSTHDTKRSEDVRARLAAISEDPASWEVAVWRWAHANDVRRAGVVDRAMEYLLYQVLVGAHPLTPERAIAYVEKAAREAKVHTSWLDPQQEYEAALRSFVEGALADAAFTDDLADVAEGLAIAGRINSLTQTVLKATCPGVPDIYQGTELWDLSLVDPDNRRRVDFTGREALLRDRAGLPGPGFDHLGTSKIHALRAALQLRASRPRSFGPEGGYEPLSAAGPASSHVVAFCRGGDVTTVVPRLPIGLQRRGGWGATSLTLPPGSWHDILGGEVHRGEVRVGELLASFPTAILQRA